MDAEQETELVVIGAGPGGYAAAIRAAQRDLDVTLVEAAAHGGVCLNTGCIPSKALISAADLVHRASTAEGMGIYAEPTVDVEELAEWRDEVTSGMSRAVQKLCRANGVELMEGTATFRSEQVLAVQRTANDTVDLGFEHAIVATGSQPIELPGVPYDADGVLDAADCLALEELPARLIVIGAGYIGMELATAFAKLGTEVAICEALDRILPGFERELVQPVRRHARDLEIEIHLGAAAEDVSTTGDGVTVTTATGDGETSHSGDAVLVAVGREPAPERVDPGAAGITIDDEGFIETGPHGETNVDGIYAVGDIAGEPMLAHAASREGTIAVASILGDEPSVPSAIPAVAFTDPEIAAVGLTQGEAEAAGHDTTVGEFPFRSSGRAATTGETTGACRLVADAETGRMLGAGVVGGEASELIGELALAVETDATLEEIAGTVHAHPTFGEAVMEAAENAHGQAIHTLNR